MPATGEDATWLYTVQLSASIQTAPPQIILSWPPDQYGAASYTVYRKTKQATSWGAGTTLPGSATSFTNTSVAIGSSYEYQVVKVASLGYIGFGYIYAGIDSPLTESRGKLILVVATNSTPGLEGELTQLQTDLIGDGWQVIRHDISSSDSPTSVRNLIRNDYYADPANVNTVFLFGHVPILQSGNLNYDGHLARPMPADSFYGDVDGDWTSSPDFLPSDVELCVGRVDLFNMPGNNASTPWPSETELLRNYLNKDHNWRHNLLTVPRKALMGNLRGDEAGEAPAASGYRNFEPLVGPGNTTRANVESTAPDEQRWISMLTSSSYLWAYGCGAGQPTAISGLGLHDGSFYDVWSADMVDQNAQAVFVMLFGSWFGNWDGTDNMLRSVLATPTTGLASCMAGRPHWFFHHMGLGETIGYSTRLTMNNSSLYQNESNAEPRAIYVSLMGDPTLRLDMPGPPANLAADANGNTVTLSWSDSSDTVAGYHVYRATNPSGPFTRITGSLITGTSYQDFGLAANSYTYMVRAIKLQTTPSGSYFNPSQGIFAPATVGNVGASVIVSATQIGNAIELNWNSEPGSVYRVQFKSTLTQPFWSNLSGTITASDVSTSWTDNGIGSHLQRFYRITATP